jgi:hypothetical protein
MAIAGHVSQAMLKHYAHVKMEAKRSAVAALVMPRTATVPEVEPGGLSDRRTGCFSKAQGTKMRTFSGLRATGREERSRKRLILLAPQVGFEPTTLRLTEAETTFPISYHHSLLSATSRYRRGFQPNHSACRTTTI